MKRILFIVLLLTAPLLGKAQSLRYIGSVEADFGFGFTAGLKHIDAYNYGRLFFGGGISTMHGIDIKDHLTLGVGAGAGIAAIDEKHVGPMEHINAYYSLFVHADYAFKQPTDKVRPYVAARLGFFQVVNCKWLLGLQTGVSGGVRINNRWDFGLWFRTGYCPYYDWIEEEDGTHNVFTPALPIIPHISAAYRF